MLPAEEYLLRFCCVACRRLRSASRSKRLDTSAFKYLFNNNFKSNYLPKLGVM